MKQHLIIYGLLILLFLVYNFFFRISNPRTDTAVNIIFASVIFGYIGFLALVVLKKLRKRR